MKVSLPSTVIVAGCPVKVSENKNPWSNLDNALSFENHIGDIVMACHFHLRALWRSLTKDVANTLTCSIVGSRMDYCSALLYGQVLDSFNVFRITWRES